MEVTFLWKLSHEQLKNLLDCLFLYSCLLVLLFMFILESVSISGKNLMFILFHWNVDIPNLSSNNRRQNCKLSWKNRCNVMSSRGSGFCTWLSSNSNYCSFWDCNHFRYLCAAIPFWNHGLWINHRKFMLSPTVIQRHLTLAFWCLLNAYELNGFVALFVAFMHLFFVQNTWTKGRLCVCLLT